MAESATALFDPLAPEVLEMPAADRFGILIGLLDVYSLRHTTHGAPFRQAGIYQEMTTRHPNGLNVDPFKFAEKCWYAVIPYSDVSHYMARKIQDQILALLAHLYDIPKREPDGVWVHQYYRTLHWGTTRKEDK